MKRNVLKFLIFLFLFLATFSLEKALAQSLSLGSCYEKCGIYDSAAACQCDEKCIIYGDCCKDICTSCPRLSICLAPQLPAYPTGAAISIQPIITPRKCTSHNDCKNLICPQVIGMDTPCCNFNTGECYCGNKECSSTTTTIPIQICRDSDGGKNYYQRGYVTIIEGLKMKWLYDYCSRNILHEYFCDGITAKEENYTCLLDCINGACIRCRDSDHGNNYFVKGNCSYVKENEVVSKADYCASEEILIEYRCSEEGCVEERFNCSLLWPKVQTIFPIKYVCKEGACKIEQQPITTTTIPNSCEGRCGIYQRGAPCQCDAYCKRYGDCCKDFCEVCKNMPGC